VRVIDYIRRLRRKRESSEQMKVKLFAEEKKQGEAWKAQNSENIKLKQD